MRKGLFRLLLCALTVAFICTITGIIWQALMSVLTYGVVGKFVMHFSLWLFVGGTVASIGIYAAINRLEVYEKRN